MTTPASRDNDPTAHGGILAAGSADVRINTLGAIRLGDLHICPQPLPVPHVGGPVRIGAGAALTVLINRRPAATIGSGCPCTDGAAPVLVGANAVGGGSDNVFYVPSNTIAGLAVTDDGGNLRIGDHIVVRGDPDYQAKVLADLAKMGTTDIGRDRLSRLNSSGHTVTIVPLIENGRARKGINAFAEALSPPNDQGPAVGGTGRGSDVEVRYSPDNWPPAPGAPPTATGAEGDVVLFHELTHADHQTHGKADKTKRNDAYDTQEEFNSIEPDENVYRRQRGFAERHSHRFV